MTSLHSRACDRLRFQAIKERNEYFKRWPNHCQDCHGMGGMLGFDADMRPSSLQVEDSYECGVCLAYGKCPRCGEQRQEMPPEPMTVNELSDYLLNKNPCQHCGWNWGKSEGDIPPLIPSCTEDCMFYGRI